MESLNITALQLDLAWHDAEANRNRIAAFLHAKQPQADLIILPEMFATGFTMEPAGLAERSDGPTVKWMQQMASQYQTSLTGSLSIEEEGKFFNRAFMVNQLGVEAQYDKRHSFSLAGEDEVYQAGNQRVITPLKGWNICLQICYDLRFPVFGRNHADAAGNFEYDLLIYVANWPAARVHHWESLLQARAIENQCYTIGVNRVGVDANGLYYSGSSMVIDPMGNVSAKAFGGEAVLQASLDADFLAATRKKYPFWRDADRFELDI
ncbi:MAG: amidohydrolase [Bacteroidota bacterium]